MSLHNTALMSMEGSPAQGFRKLNFLIQNPPFPPGAFPYPTLPSDPSPLTPTPTLTLPSVPDPDPDPDLVPNAETFANLLLLYCKHQYFDLAADVRATRPRPATPPWPNVPVRTHPRARSWRRTHTSRTSSSTPHSTSSSTPPSWCRPSADLVQT